jgi:hypothetical protein
MPGSATGAAFDADPTSSWAGDECRTIHDRMGANLFLNPADDQEFVSRVNDLMTDGVAEPTELEDQLRAWYPNAVVRPRDLANERTNLWYVYRDGHWVPTE